MRNLYSVSILFLLGANAFSQGQTPVMVNDYDTISIENAFIEYTNEDGRTFKIPFQTNDTIINSILYKPTSYEGLWYSFKDKNGRDTPVYTKTYSASKNDLHKNFNDEFISQTINFWHCKGRMELTTLGLGNPYFKLKSGNIVLSEKTTVEDFSLLFPHSYQTGLDSLKTPYNFTEHSTSEGLLCFTVRVNWCSWGEEESTSVPFSDHLPCTNKWTVKFKNGFLFSIAYSI